MAIDGEIFREEEDNGENAIVFVVGSKEHLKLTQSGAIFVKGRKVTDDLSVVQALRSFLRDTGHLKLSPSEDVGKTVIDFGKFKGRRMEEIDVVDFEQYVDWLSDQPNLTESAKTFVVQARIYLGGDPAGGTYRAPRHSSTGQSFDDDFEYDDIDPRIPNRD